MIELVVVMLISVILMGIAGSILLSSTGFFTKTTITDQDKLATDKIVEFVDGEIMYATNVIVSKKEPRYLEEIKSNNWHYFLFEKGRVYIGTVFYDGNEKFYRNSESVDPLTDSYYNNRELVVDAKGYSNSYRLDLTFSFNNQEGDVEYKTKSTLAFPNLKLQYDTATTKKGWFDSVDYSSKNNDDFFFIYYTKDAIAVDTSTGYGGTVADQIQCKQKIGDYDNDKGFWEMANGSNYKVGDFVFMCAETNAKDQCKEEDKIWYRLVKESGKWGTPGSGERSWKLITSDFLYDSDYYRGDVTIHRNNGKEYYLMYFGYKEFDLLGQSDFQLPGKKYSLFAPVQADVNLLPYCDVGISSGDSRYTHSYVIDSPAYHMYTSKIDKSAISDANNYKQGVEYPSVKKKFDNNQFVASDIVVKDGKYYVNLSEKGTKVTPGSEEASSIWYCLETVYSKNSMYFAGDIVIVDAPNRSLSYLFRAKDNILNGAEPNITDLSKNTVWEVVYFDLDKGSYQPS